MREGGLGGLAAGGAWYVASMVRKDCILTNSPTQAISSVRSCSKFTPGALFIRTSHRELRQRGEVPGTPLPGEIRLDRVISPDLPLPCRCGKLVPLLCNPWHGSALGLNCDGIRDIPHLQEVVRVCVVRSPTDKGALAFPLSHCTSESIFCTTISVSCIHARSVDRPTRRALGSGDSETQQTCRAKGRKQSARCFRACCALSFEFSRD